MNPTIHNIIVITETDPCTRVLAIKYRDQVDLQISDLSTVGLDFSNVMSMSSGFADELFGILAFRMGLIETTQRVKVIHAKGRILVNISEALMGRLSKS
jgi:hypothetical protein